MNKLAFNLGFKAVLEAANSTKELVKRAYESIKTAKVSDAFIAGFKDNIKIAAGIAERIGKKALKKTVSSAPGAAVKALETGVKQAPQALRPAAQAAQKQVNQIMTPSVPTPPKPVVPTSAPADRPLSLGEMRDKARIENMQTGQARGAKVDNSVLSGPRGLWDRAKAALGVSKGKRFYSL